MEPRERALGADACSICDPFRSLDVGAGLNGRACAAIPLVKAQESERVCDH